MWAVLNLAAHAAAELVYLKRLFKCRVAYYAKSLCAVVCQLSSIIFVSQTKHATVITEL